VLSDEDNRVANRYDVMRWQAPTGEPGHTFVLVDESGTVTWVRDFGAPDNGGLMYVVPDQLIQELRDHLEYPTGAAKMATGVRRITTVQTNTVDPTTTPREDSRRSRMGVSRSVVHTRMTPSSAVAMLSADPISSGETRLAADR